MRLPALMLCAALVCACRGGGETPQIGDPRPDETGCTDCLAKLCTRDGQLANLRLDATKLDTKGVTLTAAKLTVETADGRAATLLAPTDKTLTATPQTLSGDLAGLPAPTDSKAWTGGQARLELHYTTSTGEKGAVPMTVPLKLGACP
ncbi:MAG: hypothetical protein KC620_08815 [Myxococcales bacterium]|nr:hypothetical protein [Myxococcales bacterium]